MSFNSRSMKILTAKIEQKEKEIENAKLFYVREFVACLRDELEELNKLANVEPDFSSFIDVDSTEATEETQAEPKSPIPRHKLELRDMVVESIADMYRRGPDGKGQILLEDGTPAFSVNIVKDPNQDRYERIEVISNMADRPEYQDPSDEYPSDFWQFESGNYYNKIRDLIESGPENFVPFEVQYSPDIPNLVISNKEELWSKAKDLLDIYKGYIKEDVFGENGENLVYFFPTDDSESTGQSQAMGSLFNLLEKAGSAGVEAYNKDVKRDEMMEEELQEPASPAQEEGLPLPEETMPEGEIAMASKKFNLKKQADKVFDTIREVPRQKEDEHYQELHKKALPEYDEAYTSEKDFRENIMDKYYREYLGDDGEYHGGYIEDRFVVHHNSEGNSNHIKPGERSGPDRIESYSTERRLEEMRAANERGYYEFSDIPEGSEKDRFVTEQQNKKVLASVEVTEENGLYKVRQGEKVTYLDTESQVETFKDIVLGSEDDGSKKKNQ